MRIAREGLPFILPCLGLAFLWGALQRPVPALLFLLPATAFAFFFRDPARRPPPGEHRLTAPADGRVMAVETVPDPPGWDGPAVRIAVFLSLLDVHVTRSPIAGRVDRTLYAPGRFLPAYREESARANESNTLWLRGDRADVVVKQIVGVAARRIKCYVRTGDAVARGGRIGLMYFGSRVEIFLPPETAAAVGPGDRVRAGETVIAEVRP